MKTDQEQRKWMVAWLKERLEYQQSMLEPEPTPIEKATSLLRRVMTAGEMVTTYSETGPPETGARVVSSALVNNIREFLEDKA